MCDEIFDFYRESCHFSEQDVTLQWADHKLVILLQWMLRKAEITEAATWGVMQRKVSLKIS